MGIGQRLKAARGIFRECACAVAAALLAGGGIAAAVVGLGFLIDAHHLGDGFDYQGGWSDMEEAMERGFALGEASIDSSWLDIKRLEHAAGRGNRRAAFKLGLMYELGRGVPKDEDAALRYYMGDYGEGGNPVIDGRRAARILFEKGDCGS
ncbi:MAG: hypothetical protein ACI4NA_06975, partial [Succinivibrio sp.]